MGELAIVTGAGSGIGRALARELDSLGYSVVAVGRHRQTLESTAEGSRRVRPLIADVATVDGRVAVTEEVGNQRLAVLVHNAGRLEPVGDLAGIDHADWRQTMAVNLEAPLFLTQALLHALMEGGRVLHISSGAAHRAVRGWGAYGATKAGAYMVYRLLAEELGERGVHVGSLRPGVVDTPMQEHIRSLPVERFPDVGRFRALKEDGALVAPADVARFAARLLRDVSDERFRSGEWDIREHWHALA
jgi:NAD(P)-dependent dehydrogenase (short-subunit alcohol dehydrogenase family)